MHLNHYIGLNCSIFFSSEVKDGVQRILFIVVPRSKRPSAFFFVKAHFNQLSQILFKGWFIFRASFHLFRYLKVLHSDARYPTDSFLVLRLPLLLLPFSPSSFALLPPLFLVVQVQPERLLHWAPVFPETQLRECYYDRLAMALDSAHSVIGWHAEVNLVTKLLVPSDDDVLLAVRLIAYQEQ